MKPLYGLHWVRGEDGMMTDELGHRRHCSKVPCFLGGTMHSLRYLGDDVRHCKTVQVWVCVYDGHEINRKVKRALYHHQGSGT
jgi:hypothetical protein